MNTVPKLHQQKQQVSYHYHVVSGMLGCHRDSIVSTFVQSLAVDQARIRPDSDFHWLGSVF